MLHFVKKKLVHLEFHPPKNVKRLKSSGTVVAWGNPERGGDATKVQSQLYDIQQISCSSGAFCALRGDGHVVTWGAADLGGRIPRLVREKLLGVKEVQASQGAFAALLHDGSVVTWGDVDYGGESQVYKEELQDVRALRSSFSLFAAICGDDRHVVTWGNCSVIAGHRTGLHPSLRHVRDLVWSGYAFAAITEDGQVSTWGLPTCGADLPPDVQGQLYEVRQLAASHAAFAAVRKDGQVITWGSPDFGGDCSEVQPLLREVQYLVASSRAFCAVKADGSVVTYIKGLEAHWIDIRYSKWWPPVELSQP